MVINALSLSRLSGWVMRYTSVQYRDKSCSIMIISIIVCLGENNALPSSISHVEWDENSLSSAHEHVLPCANTTLHQTTNFVK